ncbi:MAG: hypothetical protein OXH96_00725 [Spirochaetaceae bacterium]|nr:hypothetical protein [Spirochaetaceae bacterium]MDE0445161.1 hypothetical protein [Spirochaetaceae bacterium]
MAVSAEDPAERAARQLRKERKKAEGELASGLTFSAVFVVLLLVHGGWFWIFPLAFAGMLPAVKGFLSLRRIGTARHLRAPAPPDAQTEVLKIARRQGGRITPALVAVDTPLSVEEAERALDQMVRGGYATMAVADDGRVEYEFREFLPPAAAGR